MSVVKLPRALEEKLADLAGQVRRLWLYRGLSRLAIVLLASALLAILLDVQFELSGWGRGVLFGLWLTLNSIAVWRYLWQPLRSPIPVPLLASAIEQQFPSLSERLTTLVELSENMEPGNGSRALIEVLARDTAQRTKRLNFNKAAPTRSVMATVFLAALCAAITLSPMFLVSGTGERIRRFLLPWYTPSVEIPFRVVITSGHPVIKRGEPVTLTAVLERQRADCELPETAVLVYQEEGGFNKKLPMTVDEKGAFHVTRPEVQANFDYRVEAGPARSSDYTVTVVDPVELAEGSQFAVQPPAYARTVKPEQIYPGLTEFEALQYSRILFDLRFTRPARSAYFDWKPANPNAVVHSERITCKLTPDHLAGTVDWMVIADGTLKLVLVGERDIKTEIVIATRSIVDTPPKFEKVTNVSDGVRDIRPDDRISIDLAVVDDFGVGEVKIEYQVNDEDRIRSQSIPLNGLGSLRAEGRFPFEVADKASQGDTLRLRVKAIDNRLVPEFQKGPQEVVFPEKGWSTLKLNSAARPLLEQQALGQRDKIKEKLKEMQGRLADAKRQVDSLEKEAAGEEELSRGQQAQLNKVREQSQAIAEELEELAREAALTPALRPLVDDLKQMTDETLKKADESLRRASNEPHTGNRDKNISQAAGSIAEAQERLKKLIAQNDQLAQDRLDQEALERLASEQRKLAEEAKKRGDDPEKAPELARKQEEVERKLNEILDQNLRIRQAVEQQAREEAQKLAADAKALADAQKELEEAQKGLDAATRKQALDEAIRKQKDLETEVSKLKERTDPQSALADTAPLNPQAVEQAAEKLNKGDTVGALTEQEKAARELDRLADALEKAAAARKDPREAAKQLARLEDELRRQHAEATWNKAFHELPDAQQKQMQAQQQAVRKAVESLTLPPNDATTARLRKHAADKLQQAEDALKLGRDQADKAMSDAADALRNLSEKLPTREQRLQQARAELEKLQREQASLQTEADEKLKNLEKKTPDAATRQEASERLSEAARKQNELAERLSRLDTPGLEARRDRAVTAARQAAEDLQQGRTQDIGASQRDARRQEDRLAQAMSGQKPADELADELARKQKQLADEAGRQKPDPNRLREWAEQEKAIEQQLAGIKEADAAEKLSRARSTVREAREEMQKPSGDVADKAAAAASELDRLANDLAGTQSATERVDRLARERQSTAENAQKNLGKPADPTESAASHEELTRQTDELNGIRAGEAQEAKKKASDALERLRKTPNPDRAPTLQKAAAEALKDLADQMRGKADQSAKGQRGDPDASRPSDDTAGMLPSQTDATSARQAAKQQRDIRDQLAQASEQASKGTPPTDNQKIAELAEAQKALAEQAQKLSQDMRGKSGERAAEKAQQNATRTASDLQTGAMEQAQVSGERTRLALEAAARDAGETPQGQKAKQLSEQQGRLNEKIAEVASDAGATSAQQQVRQNELAEQADRLSKKLDESAQKSPADGKVDPESLKKAAESAREASRQMDRASREQTAGRSETAGQARKQAREAMERTASQAAEAAGESKAPAPGSDPTAAEAGRAGQQAAESMQQAQKALAKRQAEQANQSMNQAAESLENAAKKLAKSGSGESKPGQGQPSSDSARAQPDEASPMPGQPGGQTPGGNDGSATAAVTTDLPADLQKYAGKPWGELPGEVKARIMQDLRARYGEDYARVIKLYFEQLAERK